MTEEKRMEVLSLRDAIEAAKDEMQYCRDELSINGEDTYMVGSTDFSYAHLETLIHAASLREPLGNEGWRDIKDAPFNERVLVLTHGGAIFSAVKHPDGFMDEDGETIGGWTACNAHPECWSEGSCWSSNVDDCPSDPPAMWMPLPSPPSTKPEEKE